MTLAITIFLLSINFEDFHFVGNSPAALKMASSYNIHFPRCIIAFKMEQRFSSVQIKRNLTAKQLVVDSKLMKQLQKINDHSESPGRAKPHLNFGRPFPNKLHLAKIYPRLTIKRNRGSRQLFRDQILGMQQTDQKTITIMGEINGIRQKGTEIS